MNKDKDKELEFEAKIVTNTDAKPLVGKAVAGASKLDLIERNTIDVREEECKEECKRECGGGGCKKKGRV